MPDPRSNSRDTAAGAAGQFIRLNPGAAAWVKPTDIEGVKTYLKPILAAIKQKIDPKEDVTDQELAAFVGEIFSNGWKTGANIRPPAQSTASKLRQTAVEFGVLAGHAPESLKQTGTARAPDRADRAAQVAMLPASSKEHRRQGAAVFLQVCRRNSGFSFAFKDSRGGLFSADDVRFIVTGYENMEDVYVEAMRAYDEFVSTQLLHFNLDMGIYVARNRLTHWANGVPVRKVPEGEFFPMALAQETLIRNSNMIPTETLAALARLKKEVSAPALFRWLGPSV